LDCIHPYGKRLVLLCLLFFMATSLGFATTTKKPVHKQTNKTSGTASQQQQHKTRTRTVAKTHTTTKSSSSKATLSSKTSSRSRSSKTTASKSKKGKARTTTQTARSHGQQAISEDRVRAIQEALIRAKYLDGEPSGVWDDQTKSALTRFQSDNGWQSKIVPDSRALIKLGLGPNHDNVLNPESSAIKPSVGFGGNSVEQLQPGGAAISQ
jgi:hypothetical protein